MGEYIDAASDGFRFVTAVCSVIICLILRDVRHDVREIKEYLVPETEEVADTIYVHKNIYIHKNIKHEHLLP